MSYNKINNLLGWLCFTLASLTYILTLEPSVSFWDCGEFISCAYKLQVSHQPGYPLFAMIGKAFSLLSMGDRTKVAYFTNLGSVLASGATIMFLFWSITTLAKKLLTIKNTPVNKTQTLQIMGAGLTGALAFTFTDTFWFSAVETIVFAWSSLCTAVVFWAILKWDAVADEPRADRWLVFIAYVIGLSIGIHLLNLLTIPALVMVYYFRRHKNINIKSGLVAFTVSILILAFVQFGIRGYTIALAARFDLFFVNSLGLGFGSGVLFFFLLIIGLLVVGIRYSIRKQKHLLNVSLLCIVFVYFGYSSFVYVPIRASAGTNLNNSHPSDAFTMYEYLNRTQYGETPLLKGPLFDAKITDVTDGTPLYRKGKNKYEVAYNKPNYVYDHTSILPRMWSTEENTTYAQDAQFYRDWLQLSDNTTPTFSDNLRWMFSWQMYQMYWRYFMWNFVGRYNDDDMEGQTNMNGIGGNWTSGLFNNTSNTPKFILNNVTYTPLYALPLVVGLLGMFYHFKKRRKDALIITLLFFFTGLAIVLYVNQPSVQPRERDYSYVGSFYDFAIWIGLGLIALIDLIPKKISPRFATIGAFVICTIVGPVLLASKEWKNHDRSTKMAAHDMAYNYLMSCPKNAILFDLGDNDTYSLWYDQEVENIRPDVRIVNLSLLSADWSVRQMQRKINQADALPITMNFEKYKLGTRDVIRYNDAKIPGYVDVKDIFDFITSDDKRTHVEYTNGTTENYLPTKNFKLAVNAADVMKNKVITPEQKGMLTDTMKWKFPPNYITKENLAMIDILAHNDWKRPICFTTSIGQTSMVGLQPYLYQEGFTYRLLPLKTDSSLADQLSKINSLVMYSNMMDKFKFGNFKTAKYLDQQSTTMFFPQMVSAFSDLSAALLKEGHRKLALNTLHKYETVMPDINPNFMTAQGKITMADTSYKLDYAKLGNKLIKSVNSYLTDNLDYNYHQLQKDTGRLSPRDVQISMSLLNNMVAITHNGNQKELSGQLTAQLNDYAEKFKSILQL